MLETAKDQQIGSPTSRKRPAVGDSVTDITSPSPRKSSRVASQSPPLQLQSKPKPALPPPVVQVEAAVLPVLSANSIVSPTKKVKEVEEEIPPPMSISNSKCWDSFQIKVINSPVNKLTTLF